MDIISVVSIFHSMLDSILSFCVRVFLFSYIHHVFLIKPIAILRFKLQARKQASEMHTVGFFLLIDVNNEAIDSHSKAENKKKITFPFDIKHDPDNDVHSVCLSVLRWMIPVRIWLI